MTGEISWHHETRVLRRIPILLAFLPGPCRSQSKCGKNPEIRTAFQSRETLPVDIVPASQQCKIYIPWPVETWCIHAFTCKPQNFVWIFLCMHEALCLSRGVDIYIYAVYIYRTYTGLMLHIVGFSVRANSNITLCLLSNTGQVYAQVRSMYEYVHTVHTGNSTRTRIYFFISAAGTRPHAPCTRHACSPIIIQL